VHHSFDSPETEACAKWTLGGLTLTGVLLMGAVLASVLMVKLPLPIGQAADGQGATQPFVPASSKWIELGAPPGSERPSAERALHSDLLHGASPSILPSRS
jgi:hypothetical protein